MATEKAETDRVPVTLALSTISYLEKLVRQGTHGTSVPGVAKTLIEEGIRLAIKDGPLGIRDNRQPQRRGHGDAAVRTTTRPNNSDRPLVAWGLPTCSPTNRPGLSN